MRITNTHVYFWGDVFSQWYESPFTLYNKKFVSAEHFMMWSKARTFNDENAADAILETQSPKIAKEIGRTVKNFNPQLWDAVKFDIVCQGSWYKFTSNTNLLSSLLGTHNKTLVEGSPTDKVWGVGLHYNDDKILDESNWCGENLLGKALMKTRQYILEWTVNLAKRYKNK